MGEVSFQVGRESITLAGIVTQSEFRSVSRAQLNVIRALIKALQDAGALNGVDFAQELLSLAGDDGASSARTALLASAGVEHQEMEGGPVLRVINGGKVAGE